MPQVASQPVGPPAPLSDFERLYAEQVDYVARALRRLGAPTADLKDLCQEVFLAAYHRQATFDATRPVRPWLFGIAFRALSALRNRAHVQREVPDHDADLALAPGLDEHVTQAQSRQLVLRALQKVPEDRRAVFILHDLDECAAPEIASSLGIPLNTVYSRLRVARVEFVQAVRRIESQKGAP